MKIIPMSLFIVGGILSTNLSANDYRLISDCITDGDSFIKSAKNIEADNPRLAGLLINDVEITSIREAEAECAKKTPEEKAELKQKWDNEFYAKYGVKPPQQPSASSGSFDHYFSPGGLFNPIHVEIR